MFMAVASHRAEKAARIRVFIGYPHLQVGQESGFGLARLGTSSARNNPLFSQLIYACGGEVPRLAPELAPGLRLMALGDPVLAGVAKAVILRR